MADPDPITPTPPTPLSSSPSSSIPSPLTGIACARHAIRKFLPTPLAPSVIRGVLEDAQAAPSNANTQPWTVHVVSGATRDRLSAGLLKAHDEGRFSYDFPYGVADLSEGIHLARAHDFAATFYGAVGVARSDRAARTARTRANLEFHGAPHAAFLFMPMFGDGVRVAADVGMYAQNFLLSLTARGLGGIPQAVLGFHADTVRDILNVPEELKLLFGISFGEIDRTAPENTFRMGRAPLTQTVTLHDTPGVL
ncbi:nitroreductase [Streptomyces sp. NPDC094437]|uniref:nitroreductase n=2 Tax=Streptomyces TaxID=1883 RepID=UPI003822D129